MVAPAVEGIDLLCPLWGFKVAGRSIAEWVPSFKMGATSPVKQPFCSHLEERLLQGGTLRETIWNVVGGENK